MNKDKPIYAPLRVLRPGWFASPIRFPLSWALGWWLLVQALAWLEPVPKDLQIQFDLNYLVLTHLCAIAGQLLLPLLAFGMLPKDQEGGRVSTLLRLSMGASLWLFLTFPLTFACTGTQASIILALGRELLWAGTLTVAIVGIPPARTRVSKFGLGALWTFAFFLGSILFALLPDRENLSNLKMDNLGTGQICRGVPQLPTTRMDGAVWYIKGKPESVSTERLSLGGRQTVMQAFDGQVLVRVASASTPPPEDTSGTTEIPHDNKSVFQWLATSVGDLLGLAKLEPSDTPLLVSLLESVPSKGSDSARLSQLHFLVHRSIRYTRSFFPGTTQEILTRGTGDCKAYAQVFCEGSRRLGYPAKVVHGLLASSDGYYAHAWVTVKTSRGWEDWDPTSSEPFPDARYLRFSAPKLATGAFDGELAIFALDSIAVFPAIDPNH